MPSIFLSSVNLSTGVEFIERDLIFISYATEDTQFTDWLALKLTGAGYKVWYDRMSLLAGQSFVKEVDEAIGHRTYRLLAVLSKSSITKENPTNERTKAIAVGKALKIDDFIITLNLDGLLPSEIPWTLSQKSYADFHSSWSEGLASVLKALQASNAPCDPTMGRNLVCQWTSQRDQAIQRIERIWTNLIPVVSYPTGLRQYELRDPDDLDSLKKVWPIAIQNNKFVWSFVEPPKEVAKLVDFQRTISWIDQTGIQGLKIRNFAKYLIRRSVEDYCLSKGLVRSEDGESIYFPTGLLDQDKHFYQGLFGKRTYLKFVGKSTFRTGPGKTEVNRHHISPSFKLVEREGQQLQIQIINRVFLTTEDGTAIHPTRMNRRRKKICKNWWNDKWGARLLAFMSWMSDGKSEFEVFQGTGGVFTLSGLPLALTSTHGIDETSPDDLEVLEEIPENTVDDMESMDPTSDFGNDGSGALEI